MKTSKLLSALLLAAVLASAPAVSRADPVILPLRAPSVDDCKAKGAILSLRTPFVTEYKDKATLDTRLSVDHAHKSPNSIIKDGDIHIAGRDTTIRLPLVVEIINGALMKAARERLSQAKPDRPIPVSGVWRLWFEHPGRHAQIQGQPVPVPKNSGPDHLFEIHPVTAFDGVDMRESFTAIKNEKNEFRGKDAQSAFAHYESRVALMWSSKTAILIQTSRAFHNYTEFQIELAGQPKAVGDGLMVFAHVYDIADDSDEPIVPDRLRMVFVEGTPAAKALRGRRKGDRLHVLGIPRVNLSEVYALAVKHGEEGVCGKLPYEMIISAVYDPEED